MIGFSYLSQKDEMPSWQNAIPAKAIRKANKTELPPSYSFGYIARVPLIETPIYLEYLFDEFRGDITLEEVLSFDEVCAPDTIVINCTGLGAKLLTDDTQLYPVRGQIVKTKASPNLISAADDDPDHFFYIIPRRDCVVLGGTAEANIYNEIPNKSTTNLILERAIKVAPEIKDLPVLNVEVGLRPYRSSIRLEKETNRNLIHNYGHGGSGFTVSWGCANAVLKLVQQFE